MVTYSHAIGKRWQKSDVNYNFGTTCTVFNKKCGTVVEPSGDYCPMRIKPGYECTTFDLSAGNYKHGECREIGVFVVNVNDIRKEVYTQSSLWKGGLLLVKGDIDHITDPKDDGFKYWACWDFRTYFGWDTDEVQMNGNYKLKRAFSNYSDMRSPYKNIIQTLTITNAPSEPTPPTGRYRIQALNIVGDVPIPGAVVTEGADVKLTDNTGLTGWFIREIDAEQLISITHERYNDFSDGWLFQEFLDNKTVKQSLTLKTEPPPEEEWFKCVGDFFINIDWLTPVYHEFKKIGNIFHTIQTWKEGIDTKITGFLGSVGIIALVSSTYSIVNHTWKDVTDAISNASIDISDWIDTNILGVMGIIDKHFNNVLRGTVTTPAHIKLFVEKYAGSLPSGFPTSLTALLTLIKTTISNTYSIVNHTWEDVTNAIDAASGLIPAWLPTTLTSMKNLIISTIRASWSLYGDTSSQIVTKAKTTILGWFPYDVTNAHSILVWLGITAGDVITTILNTPSEMVEWLKESLESKYTILTKSYTTLISGFLGTLMTGYYSTNSLWVSFRNTIYIASNQVWDGWGKSAEELAIWISPYLPTFPSGFPTTLTGVKVLIIDTISNAFESVLDKVFK